VIFGYGGLQDHFLDLGKLLVENGAEVTFATRLANPEVLKMPVWREAPFKVLTTQFISGAVGFRRPGHDSLALPALQLL